MLFKILVLILRRWLMFTPHVFLIKDKFPLLYQFCCMFKWLFIQFDCHGSNLLFRSPSRLILFCQLRTGSRATCLVAHRKPKGETGPGFGYTPSLPGCDNEAFLSSRYQVYVVGVVLSSIYIVPSTISMKQKYISSRADALWATTSAAFISNHGCRPRPGR